MFTEEEAKEKGRALKDAGIDDHGYLRMYEEAEEFGDGYALHLHTDTHMLRPELLGILSDAGMGITYIGEMSSYKRHLWLVES